MFATPTIPNLADYTLFLRGAGITTGVLPDNSDWIIISFNVAMAVVDDLGLGQASPMLYTLAVYNLATDRLLNFAPDITGQTYFADQRSLFKLLAVPSGVPSAASDQGTAVGILNPEFMKKMTMQDLQTMKTPYGRQYMAFALTYGPSLWGLT